MKKLVLLSLVIATGALQIGCSAREIGAGAIGVAIGVGIGRHHHDHHHHRRGRHHHHRGCDIWGCWGGVNQIQGISREAVVSDFASDYQIPVTAAAKITDAFAKSQNEGLVPFRALGLTDNDFKALMDYKLPSPQTVKTASAKLDVSEHQARNLLIAMMKNFNAQATNVKSAYWKYCTSDGSWKTDRNRSCAKLSWPGCSPATGAKFCY